MNDIKYLYAYTVSYEKYMLLSQIKRDLISSNPRVEWALTPIDKWILFLVYKDYNDSEEHKAYSDFLEKRIL
ncbi:hypothetical protein P7H70_09675 [Vagococcus carniphilus]|uniref:Uncharacterized protein n=2 Tax=Vagococcus carniphilus TaxID=218144 RepID=A0AAW8U5G4_9ENTE|nr:hypothetical protein [Vagococcus carniphilus]